MSTLTALFVGACAGSILETLAILLLTVRGLRRGTIVFIDQSPRARRERTRDKMLQEVREAAAASARERATEDGRDQ